MPHAQMLMQTGPGGYAALPVPLRTMPVQQFPGLTASPFAPSVSPGSAPPQDAGGVGDVADTGTTIANRKLVRLEAHLKAIRPLATAGDLEAQHEVLELQGKIKTVNEQLCDIKSPAEKVRTLTTALNTRQTSLLAAEAALVANRTTVMDREAAVRAAQHEVEGVTLKLTNATAEAAPPTQPHIAFGGRYSRATCQLVVSPQCEWCLDGLDPMRWGTIRSSKSGPRASRCPHCTEAVASSSASCVYNRCLDRVVAAWRCRARSACCTEVAAGTIRQFSRMASEFTSWYTAAACLRSLRWYCTCQPSHPRGCAIKSSRLLFPSWGRCCTSQPASCHREQSNEDTSPITGARESWSCPDVAAAFYSSWCYRGGDIADPHGRGYFSRRGRGRLSSWCGIWSLFCGLIGVAAYAGWFDQSSFSFTTRGRSSWPTDAADDAADDAFQHGHYALQRPHADLPVAADEWDANADERDAGLPNSGMLWPCPSSEAIGTHRSVRRLQRREQDGSSGSSILRSRDLSLAELVPPPSVPHCTREIEYPNAWPQLHQLSDVPGNLDWPHSRVWIGSRHTLATLLSPWAPPLLLTAPWSRLLPCTRDAASPLQFGACVSPIALEIHVDGSGLDGGVWAFVVVWQSLDLVWRYGGYWSGRVILDETSAAFLGASLGDLLNAELSGLTSALAFSLQYCGGKLTSDGCGSPSIKIFYDDQAAAHSADATWYVHGAGSLPAIATSLYHLIDACASVSLHHEYGHALNPWNEFCDKMCSVMLDDLSSPFWCDLGTPVSTLTIDALAAQWLFIACLPVTHRAQFSLEETSGEFYLSVAACPFMHLGLEASVIAKRIDGYQADELSDVLSQKDAASSILRVVQINANTHREQVKIGDLPLAVRE